MNNEEIWEKVMETSEEYLGISEDLIKSPSRLMNIVAARHIATYLFKEITREKPGEVAQRVNRDRTSIYNIERIVRDRLKFDRDFRQDYETFEQKLTLKLQ